MPHAILLHISPNHQNDHEHNHPVKNNHQRSHHDFQKTHQNNHPEALTSQVPRPTCGSELGNLTNISLKQ